LEDLILKKKCKDGYRWCPITKKCKPNTDDGKGKGRGMGRGGGVGPLGIPVKETIEKYLEFLE